MTEEELFSYYQDRFKPIYADYVAVSGQKNLIIDAQIEQSMSHLAVSKTSADPAEQQSNLDSAYGHLVRACLDATKLYWLHRLERIKTLTKDELVRKFCLNLSAGQFAKHQAAAEAAMIAARRSDVAYAGHNAEKTLDLYNVAIQYCEEMLAAVDFEKMDSIKNFRLWHLIKSQFVGFLVGVAASVMASIIYARM